MPVIPYVIKVNVIDAVKFDFALCRAMCLLLPLKVITMVTLNTMTRNTYCNVDLEAGLKLIEYFYHEIVFVTRSTNMPCQLFNNIVTLIG